MRWVWWPRLPSFCDGVVASPQTSTHVMGLASPTLMLSLNTSKFFPSLSLSQPNSTIHLLFYLPPFVRLLFSKILGPPSDMWVGLMHLGLGMAIFTRACSARFFLGRVWE